MRKILLIIIAIIVVVSIWIIVNMFTGGSNDALNKAFNPIDYSCNVDSDCAKKGTDCDRQCGGECVNKNWKLSCPLPENAAICNMVMNPAIVCKCINNECAKYDTILNQTTESMQ